MKDAEKELLIAYRIMGYLPLYDVGMYGYVNEEWDRAGTVQFRPSVRMEDALMVLEKLREQGYHWRMQSHAIGYDSQIENLIPDNSYYVSIRPDMKKKRSADHRIGMIGPTLIGTVLEAAYALSLKLPQSRYEVEENDS